MNGVYTDRGLYRIEPESICARLPKAYFCDRLDLTLWEDVWSYEVVGRIPNGRYRLVAGLEPGAEPVGYSIDGRVFETPPTSGLKAVLETEIEVDHERLSFYVRTSARPPVQPLRDLTMSSARVEDVKVVADAGFPRDTELSRCNLWGDRWAAAQGHIEGESFNLNLLPVMRDEIIDWSAGRQVLDREDPHYGAIYSEEDKYCFVDAAFAALAFERRHARTGDPEWRQRAVATRDYAFKGQYRGTGNPQKDGAWASMGIIDDPRGSSFRRITDPWRQASGVDMDIICTVASQLTELGLSCTPSQVTQIREACVWQKRNALGKGWFSHHEGMDLNCLNVCALGAAQVYAAHRILRAGGCAGVDTDLLDDALQAYRHVLACQESIGVIPYRMGDHRRGGKYWMQNLPDNGMTWVHLLRFACDPESPVNIKDDPVSLRRCALWYLLCSRWEDGRLNLAYDASRECYEHSIGFGNFTWCRITMLDVISQIWEIIGDRDFWKQFVRDHLRTIRETAWNTKDPDSAPIQASVVPVRLVSWVQRAEWAAVVFDNLSVRFGVEPPTADM